jgi:hypothetical protein
VPPGPSAAGCARKIDAGVALEESEDPHQVALGALLTGDGEDAPELLPLVGGALAQGVDEHERALALPDVAEELLAVLGPVADQVQDVVLDLISGRADRQLCKHSARKQPYLIWNPR